MEAGPPLVKANWKVTANDSHEARMITAKLITAERFMYRYSSQYFCLLKRINEAYLELICRSSSRARIREIHSRLFALIGSSLDNFEVSIRLVGAELHVGTKDSKAVGSGQRAELQRQKEILKSVDPTITLEE